MPSPSDGRHENGQNFLADRRVVRAVNDVVARTSGPIVEIGAGDGALTLPLSTLGRPVLALELHPPTARRLTSRAPANVTVHTADVLTYTFPRTTHVVIGNLPFHLTTAILRRLLSLDHWSEAVLIAQWEVARRRAGVGGATMLTASWLPWFDFALHQRIPRAAFRPMPSVDGGLFSIHRRAQPMVGQRPAYQSLVREVFTTRGSGLGEILPRVTGLSRRRTTTWLRSAGLSPSALPRDLDAGAWASLWRELGTDTRGIR